MRYGNPEVERRLDQAERTLSQQPPDHTRSAATQPYRTTEQAQQVCRAVDQEHQAQQEPLATVAGLIADAIIRATTRGDRDDETRENLGAPHPDWSPGITT
jgi:ApbE superfamily uncharacterized protein (UPF0280 family)